MGQLSFYSADARPRAVSDLEGLLCAGGTITRFGRGTSARLTIVLGTPPAVEPVEPAPVAREPEPVDAPRTLDPDDVAFLDLDPEELARLFDRQPHEPPEPVIPARATSDPLLAWRAHAVRCALRARGVGASVDHHPDGRPVVRSAFRADLVPLTRAWEEHGVELDGPRLRLWVLAAGAQHGPAYTLGLDPDAVHRHEGLLTASRRAGLGATLAGVAGAPVLRIAGRRRLGRLVELVGRPPRDLAEGVWPV